MFKPNYKQALKDAQITEADLLPKTKALLDSFNGEYKDYVELLKDYEALVESGESEQDDLDKIKAHLDNSEDAISKTDKDLCKRIKNNASWKAKGDVLAQNRIAAKEFKTQKAVTETNTQQAQAKPAAQQPAASQSSANNTKAKGGTVPPIAAATASKNKSMAGKIFGAIAFFGLAVFGIKYAADNGVFK